MKDPSETRNLGIDKSHGDFIFFLDSDDYIQSNFVSSMVNTILNDNSDMCICNVERITNGSSRIQCTESISKYLDFSYSKKSDYIIDYILSEKKHKYSIWNRIYKADIIKSNRINFINYRSIISEDMLFNINVLKYVNRISWIQDPLYKHYIRQGALTTSSKPDILKRARKQIDLLYEIISDSDFIEAYPYLCIKILNMGIDYSIFHNKNGIKELRIELETIRNIPQIEHFVQLAFNNKKDPKITLEQYLIIKLIDGNFKNIHMVLFYIYKKSRYYFGHLRKTIIRLVKN